MNGKRRPQKQRDDLALAIATGGTVAEWCEANQVPERTARDWVATAEFKALVLAHRRQINDRVIGGYVRFRLEALTTVANLMKSSANDGVKLSAARTILEGGGDFEDRHELRERIKRLEDRIDVAKK